jgi:hypothetical protein
MLTVTYVTPRHMDRSAAESERVAAVLTGTLTRGQQCHVVPDCQAIKVGARKTCQQRLNPKSVMAGLRLQAGDAFEKATKVTSQLSPEQSRAKGQAHLFRGSDVVDRLAEKARPKYDDGAIENFTKARGARKMIAWAADRVAEVIQASAKTGEFGKGQGVGNPRLAKRAQAACLGMA